MKRAVILICDSLRADLITPRDAPFLSEFGKRSARFANHASVFPSTTRTSAASIATGCLPAGHGLLGNTMAIDEGDSPPQSAGAEASFRLDSAFREFVAPGELAGVWVPTATSAAMFGRVRPAARARLDRHDLAQALPRASASARRRLLPADRQHGRYRGLTNTGSRAILKS